MPTIMMKHASIQMEVDGVSIFWMYENPDFGKKKVNYNIVLLELIYCFTLIFHRRPI